jgi:hypothetical protein
MRIRNLRGAREVTFTNDDGAITFRGRHLAVGLDNGQPSIKNAELIDLPNAVLARSTTRGGKALFAFTSSVASVIIEQPSTLSAPSFSKGAINLTPIRDPASTPQPTMRFHLEMLSDRCQVCGTHPNSVGDVEIMECISGNSTCYRCVSWEC